MNLIYKIGYLMNINEILVLIGDFRVIFLYFVYI